MKNKNKLKIQIIGPFATEYSLAKVNRSLAFALQKFPEECEVSLLADADFCDRLPTAADLQKYPLLRDLMTDKSDEIDVAIIGTFPKSIGSEYGLSRIKAKCILGYLGWEETIYPKQWVAEFNKYAHGMLVISTHVAHVFSNSGLSIPIHNARVGLNVENFQKSEPYELHTKKQYKFLHISSAHFRKGIDILLKAYYQEFNAQDDVSLVLKIFPNPNSQVEPIMKELQRADAPEVLVINDADLTDGQIASLYEQCDAVVAPSRAEGFGLPMAEAMLMRKPLITTAYSGQMDFCNEQNSFLLDYSMRNSDSQLGIPGSKVAEPSLEDMRKYLRLLYDNPKSEDIANKVAQAAADVADITWENSARQVLNFAAQIFPVRSLKGQKLAVVSTFNSICGIAEYTRDLLGPINSSFERVGIYANLDAGDRVYEDDANVMRTWEYGDLELSKTITEIDKFAPDIVNIQYNPPFYSLETLGSFIADQAGKKRRVVLTLHAIQDNHLDFRANRELLEQAHQILVHSPADLAYLSNMGYTKISYFKHGIPTFADESKLRLRKRLGLENKFVVASHGMIHDKKGLLELLAAIEIIKKDIPDILLLAVNALNPNNITSANTHSKMLEFISKAKLQEQVLLLDKFLENPEIVKLLHLADILVFPYPELKESASGAVRKAMAAMRPVLITQSHIFSDLDAGMRLPDNSPANIAKGITALLTDSNLYNLQLTKVKDFVAQNSWQAQSLNFLNSLT